MQAPVYFVISPPTGITPPFVSPAKSPYEDVKAYKRRLRRQFQTKRGRGKEVGEDALNPLQRFTNIQLASQLGAAHFTNSWYTHRKYRYLKVWNIWEKGLTCSS